MMRGWWMLTWWLFVFHNVATSVVSGDRTRTDHHHYHAVTDNDDQFIISFDDDDDDDNDVYSYDGDDDTDNHMQDKVSTEEQLLEKKPQPQGIVDEPQHSYDWEDQPRDIDTLQFIPFEGLSWNTPSLHDQEEIGGRQRRRPLLLPRSFQVEPKHERTPRGVRFHIETVEPPADHKDRTMERISRSDAIQSVNRELRDFYMANGHWGWEEFRTHHCGNIQRENDDDDVGDYDYDAEEDCYYAYQDMLRHDRRVEIEAMSDTPETMVFSGGHGFLAACVTAFAKHLPLSLDPTDIWTVLSYAFAKHVEIHAEELRNKFVTHAGKKVLEVRVDHFVKSFKSTDGSNNGGDDDNEDGRPDHNGTPASEWERDAFPDFSNQIKNHIGESIHTTIAGNFTTTTATTRAASEISLMSAMKQYFSYQMSTACGIPSIELRGTKEDWIFHFVPRAEEAMGNLMTVEFSQKWIIPIVLPILDEFIRSYDGTVVNYMVFWQSMIKFRSTTGSGSAYYEFYLWMDTKFISPTCPIPTRTHTYIRPWQESYYVGPELSDFPSIRSSCVQFYGITLEKHFNFISIFDLMVSFRIQMMGLFLPLLDGSYRMTPQKKISTWSDDDPNMKQEFRDMWSRT